MSYQEEELVRLRRQISQQAIALAMEGRWREAIAINKRMIESFPNDVGACNRLGRAHMELGEYSQAREAYSRAVELDPYNAIAIKNLRRLSYLEGSVASSQSDSQRVEPQHFIEEIGKAGVVSLCHLAPPEVLARMVSGDRLHLKIDGANLTVGNGRGEYLGLVEPKYGHRLIKLIEGGNRYSAAIVSSTENQMTIIIREIYQDPSQAGRLYFPPRDLDGPRTYVSHRMLRRESEHEESGYTIIGGEEIEPLPEESLDIDDQADNEE